MLCILFTKKKLLAGLKTDIPQLLKIRGKSLISYDGAPKHEVLANHLEEICQGYLQTLTDLGKDADQPIRVALAFPMDMINKQAEKVQILEVLKNHTSPNIEVVHSENLALTFIYGLKNQDHLPEQNSIVLEAIDDYLHLCYHLHGEKEVADVKEMGAAALHTDERFSFESIKDFGRSAGNEQVLNELLQEFSSAGLAIDVKGQTDLAIQLIDPPHTPKHIYTLSKTTQHVNIEAEIQLSSQRYGELMTSGRENIARFLSEEARADKGIDKVILLGSFWKNEALHNYFRQELKLDGQLISMEGGSEYDEFAAMVEGLSFRTEEVLEAEEMRKVAEEKRKHEEVKRAKIEAELQVKDDRESLLEELQTTCVDPSLREVYEERFVHRGIKLGIPDVVIKWNISEVLGRIALQKEVETVGTEGTEASPTNQEETKEESELSQNAASNGHQEETADHQESETKQSDLSTSSPSIQEAVPQAQANTLVAEKIEKATETVAPQLEEVKEEIVPVIEEAKEMAEAVQKEANQQEVVVETKETAAKAKKSSESSVSAEAKKTKTVKEEKGSKKTKDSAAKDRPKLSLNDIFLIKGSLPDQEFSTKEVTFQTDQEIRVVRVLSTKDQKNPEKVAAFQKLYQKEIAYYENLSEMSEAKEGTYYYRPFFERTTLADHVQKNGLDQKKNLEDLSSADLKFILQIFKEVQELAVPHADLTKDNILILAKRKWNLQKNMEVKFVGFTSQDATTEEMVEQTHKVFAELIGEKLYQNFREKFQL